MHTKPRNTAPKYCKCSLYNLTKNVHTSEKPAMNKARVDVSIHVTALSAVCGRLMTDSSSLRASPVSVTLTFPTAVVLLTKFERNFSGQVSQIMSSETTQLVSLLRSDRTHRSPLRHNTMCFFSNRQKSIVTQCQTWLSLN